MCPTKNAKTIHGSGQSASDWGKNTRGGGQSGGKNPRFVGQGASDGGRGGAQTSQA